MYEKGQILNIGWYGGYRHQKLIKTQAEITDISSGLIFIKVRLHSGGFRKMFGYAGDLKRMEENYFK